MKLKEKKKETFKIKKKEEIKKKKIEETCLFIELWLSNWQRDVFSSGKTHNVSPTGHE